MLEDPPVEFTAAMQKFMFDSIGKIHEVQDPARYFRWVSDHYRDYFGDFIDLSNEHEVNTISLSSARPIWNATPLRSNRYRPEPLPKLSRNDRCYCGSGEKFKQCCQRIEGQMQAISTEDTWPVLLQMLSAEELREVMELQALPAVVLIGLAEDAFEDGDYEFTCSTLDILFENTPANLKEEGDYAITLMCNACDELKQINRKQAFLARQSKSDNKWLRSGALQRSAAMLIDMDDTEAAWSALNALNAARKLTPNDPGIDTLELFLLLSDGQLEQAQRRAEMIQKKWKRQNIAEEAAESFEFIQLVIQSPESALDLLNADENNDILDRLRRWIEIATAETATPYEIEEVSTQALDVDPLKRERSYTLETPATLRKIEADWLQIYTGDKSFLDNILVESEISLQEVFEWLAFLDQHPQAFDSIMILDDIVSLLQHFEGVDSARIFDHILSPIYQRVDDIITPFDKDKRFDWGFMDNRPFLRLLGNHIFARWRRGEYIQTLSMMERQIRLNPQDNQGIRCLLMNLYLKLQSNQLALELAENYQDDISPEIALGKVLALYRLNQHEEAAAAWIVAQKYFRYAKRYLTVGNVSSPEHDDSPGIILGSEEEMWMYREDMRDTWLRTRGIMGWLKKA